MAPGTVLDEVVDGQSVKKQPELMLVFAVRLMLKARILGSLLFIHRQTTY